MGVCDVVVVVGGHTCVTLWEKVCGMLGNGKKFVVCWGVCSMYVCVGIFVCMYMA